jgi:hemerythrin-like metal-binding protein
MALFTWSREYSVGNDLMDGEHQTLFEMGDRLHNAMLAGRGHAVLRSLFTQLADYTRTHFSHEEALMARCAYPELTAHADLHRELTARFSQLQDDLNGGKTEITMDTLQFVRDWLQRHIDKKDRLVARHVREAHMAHR